MKYVTKSTNTEFNAIMSRRSNHNPDTVALCKVLKSGKPGKPVQYKMYGNEKTAADVIARLEKNNPGSYWLVAEI